MKLYHVRSKALDGYYCSDIVIQANNLEEAQQNMFRYVFDFVNSKESHNISFHFLPEQLEFNDDNEYSDYITFREFLDNFFLPNLYEDISNLKELDTNYFINVRD